MTAESYEASPGLLDITKLRSTGIKEIASRNS